MHCILLQILSWLYFAVCSVIAYFVGSHYITYGMTVSQYQLFDL